MCMYLVLIGCDISARGTKVLTIINIFSPHAFTSHTCSTTE